MCIRDRCNKLQCLISCSRTVIPTNLVIFTAFEIEYSCFMPSTFSRMNISSYVRPLITSIVLLSSSTEQSPSFLNMPDISKKEINLLSVTSVLLTDLVDIFQIITCTTDNVCWLYVQKFKYTYNTNKILHSFLSNGWKNLKYLCKGIIFQKRRLKWELIVKTLFLYLWI